ncbi:tripartite tricarboxylate transporter substrate binding protein [Pistricoccus aurantiacus]|uniref:Tripartite tricarboxylate transporter substrate binding protein n=1 Tax=Pistricoccus aurantiacus TaxID=1883414 RepID=A0A5B8SSF4_9GAMM|nr:tripartite tricarboxylate transporter substrate binding protein [Pistricoccus aurantiacus]QEA39204.1 tripartite tricarboxylate transporter substrate binding protein [Pistricoccus aurantiacus]
MNNNSLLLKSKIAAVSFAAITAFMTSSSSMSAEEFPSNPLSMIVSYSAGGATDFQARIVTSKAEQYLGEPVTVINRPGAGGQVGWNYLVQNGGQEGYDLAAYNVPHFIAQSLMYDTYYDIDNLEPIANWGADPAVLIVGKNSQFDTIDDLVAYAKENPGKITVSGAGLFVGHHIAMLQLEEAADISLKYIPTSGGVDALRFVQGGQVMAGFNNLSDAYRSRDRLKILGVADLERNEAFLPEVPTFQEAGYEVDDSSVNFRGIMTRSGVPEDRLEMLSEKMVEMFNDEDIKTKMEKGGSPMRVMGRAELKEMWQQRQAFLKELFENLDGAELEQAK